MHKQKTKNKIKNTIITAIILGILIPTGILGGIINPDKELWLLMSEPEQEHSSLLGLKTKLLLWRGAKVGFGLNDSSSLELGLLYRTVSIQNQLLEHATCQEKKYALESLKKKALLEGLNKESLITPKCN